MNLKLQRNELTIEQYYKEIAKTTVNNNIHSFLSGSYSEEMGNTGR